MGAWVGEERLSGAVLHVTEGGETVLEQAYGYAHLYDYGAGQYGGTDAIVRRSSPIPMTTDTRFDMASVTKVLATTTALMMLVEKGIVDLEAPVSAYLPDFSEGPKGTITIRHLLTHRAGLRQWEPTYYHAANADEAYAYVRDLPLAWAVGSGRHYSDLGFMLLGRIVETVSGQRLNDFVRTALYEPLGLRATGFGPTDSTAGPRAATSHGNPYEYRMVHDPDFGYEIEGDPHAWGGWRERTLVGEVNDGNAHHAFEGVAGHAGLFASAADAGVLMQFILDRGAASGRRLLSEAVVDAFLTPAVPGQALGWQLPDYAPAGSFGHTGFTGTFVLASPSHDVTIVLLTNRQNLGVDSETQYTDLAPLQRAVTQAILGERSP
ncbi:MAG: serine hydrolase [Gemmatimonadota bacterium]|nr:serine hydrolase [Gemmatimonadota bacterium]